jgi:hypothetical protein
MELSPTSNVHEGTNMTARTRLLLAAERAIAKSQDPARHKCFLSYHRDDVDEVEAFIESFGEVFIPRVIGVTDDDDFIDSTNTDYVMDCIREQYLTNSTVTIVLVGKCTWARRYVDWEVYSTLRNDKSNRRSGLMAVTLPSVANETRRLPARVEDNVINQTEGYAEWWKYPVSAEGLRSHIQTAFDARNTLGHLILNTRARKLASSSC